jgi:hypothetical protein
MATRGFFSQSGEHTVEKASYPLDPQSLYNRRQKATLSTPKKRFYGGKKAKRLEAVIDQAVSP